MRKRDYVGALALHGDHLALVTLRHAGEVVDASALEPPAASAPTAKEKKLAQQLIAALEDEFDATAFRERYRERVRELIEAKAAGDTVRTPDEEETVPEPEQSLSGALRSSLRAAKERKIA
jgi:DNA end-binding protein Ku